MGPIRPKYIVKIIISLPKLFRLAVKFLDRPTVAVALTASKNVSSAGALFVAIKRTVEVMQIVMNVTATAIAFLTEEKDMQRPKSVALFLFLTVARAEQNRTATVTVLIPPAVPTGEPPISINISETTQDALVRFS